MDTKQHARNILVAINLAKSIGMSEDEQVDAIKLALDAIPSNSTHDEIEAAMEPDMYKRAFLFAGYKPKDGVFVKRFGCMHLVIKKSRKSSEQKWELLFYFASYDGEVLLLTAALIEDQNIKNTEDALRAVLHAENSNFKPITSFKIIGLDDCQDLFQDLKL